MPTTPRPRRNRQTLTKQRHQHFNQTRAPDQLSTFLSDSFDALDISMREFSLTFVRFSRKGQKAYEAREPRPISNALVARIVQGTRPLPIGDIPAWIKNLGIDPDQSEAFALAVITSNALRSVRRTLAPTEPARKLLEPALERQLIAQLGRITAPTPAKKWRPLRGPRAKPQ